MNVHISNVLDFDVLCICSRVESGIADTFWLDASVAAGGSGWTVLSYESVLPPP